MLSRTVAGTGLAIRSGMPYLGSVPTVTAKKKCCKDKPRCGKCPVVLKRLADAEVAAREDVRTYTLSKKVPKKILAAARAR